MRQELEEISYKYEGKTILNLWKMITKLEEIHNVHFSDYYNSFKDFDDWADSKGHGQTDPDGELRAESRIWYRNYENDIKKGLWIEKPYACFMEMFLDDIEDLGNDESEEIYELWLDLIMENAIKKDKKEFGKADFRVHLTGLLIAEFGNRVLVDQIP